MKSDFQFHDLAGKTLVITGITRGIGRALLPGLLAQGVNLIAVSLGRKEMEAVRADLGVDETRLRLFECDLADPAAFLRTMRSACHHWFSTTACTLSMAFPGVSPDSSAVESSVSIFRVSFAP
jgi:NAD(P)-dependent dehydrogenase (short-subunit alcohol dehydrogenase family)